MSPKVLITLPKTTKMLAGQTVIPFVINVFMGGSSVMFFIEEQKTIVKVLKAQVQSRKAKQIVRVLYLFIF